MPKKSMTKQLYMVVERYKDAAAVYRRLWDRGRMGPEGLVFVSAWFDEDVERLSVAITLLKRKINSLRPHAEAPAPARS